MKALFLDRDGVVNIDYNYVHKIEDFEFVDDIFEVCKLFGKKGYEIFIVTNQSGINRGYYTKDDFLKLTDWMLERFKENGITVKDVSFCPHTSEQNCSCRKPKPGMLLDLAKRYDIDLKHSFMIGDKQRDIDSAINAGLKEQNCLLVESNRSFLDKVHKQWSNRL